jgi:O-antigen/teichoic acid export membrane protein
MMQPPPLSNDPTDPMGKQSAAAEHERTKLLTSAVQDIFKRGSLYVVVYASQLLSGFLVTPILTRELGGSGFGRFATALAVAQVISGIAALGLQVAIQRQYATDGPTVARGLVMLALLLSVAITGLTYATGPWWAPGLGFPGFSGALALAVIWAGATAGSQIALAYVRSQDHLRFFVALNAAQSLGAQLLGIGLVLFSSPTPESYFLGLLIGQGVTLVTALAAIRPIFAGLKDGTQIKKAMALSLPLLPHAAAIFVINAAGRVVLQRDMGPRSVGRYQVAYNVAALAMILLGFLNQSWEPRIYEVTDIAVRRSLLGVTRDVVYRCLFPLLAGLILAGPAVMRLFAPPSYDTSHLLVVLLFVAIAAIPYASYAASMRVLLSEGYTRPLLWIAPVCGVAVLALNLLLVPAIGINGSALASLMTYGLLAILSHREARRLLPVPPSPKHVIRRILVTVATCSALTLLPDRMPYLALRTVVAALCGIWLLACIRQGWGGLRSDPDDWRGPASMTTRVLQWLGLTPPRRQPPAPARTTLQDVEGHLDAR